MPDSVEISELERRTLAKVKRYMFAYIISGQVLYQLDRTNIGFAQLTMGKELALTAQAFGLASGIFAVGAFIMQVPAGLLFEKYGARRWLTFNMAAWGLVVVAQAFVSNRVELTILRFLLGVFEASYLPGLFILISLWFKGRHQGALTAGIQIGLGLSGALGGPFAGWILGQSLLGLSGWRSLFLIEGSLTILWALLALRILHNDPREASWLKPEEREFMAQYLADYQAQKVAQGALEKTGVWSSLKDLRIVTLLLAYTCSGWVAGTLIFFMPILLKRVGAGLPNQTVGFLAAVPYIVNAIVSFFWAAHADRTERHWHTVLPLLVCAVGMLLYPIATALLLAMLVLAMAQAGNGSFFVNFWPACNMVVGKKTIAKSTAFIQSGTLAGSFFAPIFFGWALDVTGNTNLGLYTCVSVEIATFVMMNIFFFRYKAQQKRQTATVLTSHEI